MQQILTREQSALAELFLWVAERLARSAARCSRHLPFDDLLQIARTGLLEAALRYDVNSGTPFDKFAWKRIYGRIVRALGYESKHHRRATLAFLSMLDAAPVDTSTPETDGQVSALIDERCDDAALTLFLALTSSRLEIAGEDGAVRCETATRAARLIDEALDGLDEDLRLVVRLRYWEALDWSDTSEKLHVSRATAQRKELEARKRIRRHLCTHGVDSLPEMELP